MLALARGGLDCSRTVPHVLLCRSLTADKILINTDRPDWLHLLICCWPGSLHPWLPHPDDEYELAKLWKHFLKHCFTNWQFFSSLFIDHSFSLFDSIPTPNPHPTCGYWNLSMQPTKTTITSWLVCLEAAYLNTIFPHLCPHVLALKGMKSPRSVELMNTIIEFGPVLLYTLSAIGECSFFFMNCRI